MKIEEKKAIKLIDELKTAAQNSILWEKTWNKYAHIQALLSFPSGELMNPRIEEFLIGWEMNHVVQYGCPIVLDDRFNAQGLEGCVRVQTDLITALKAYQELPRYRRALATIQKI